MPRLLDDWLSAYVKYASIAEAPKIFHFWAGVSAIAGALRRHVWFDQIKFKWYPSFFIVFVAPPGIATKSTTVDGAIDLLREVPGIHFGPDEVTWPSLVTTFAGSAESFAIGDLWYPQSAITIAASEFGMYMDFRDTKMVNLHITLWDGRKRFEKQTKHSGSDSVEAPWINLIACTTPKWISSNMDANTIGGGFTSRCVFVFADKKDRPVAYLKNMFNGTDVGAYEKLRLDLIHDLEHIAVNLLGEYRVTPEAEEWGDAWYNEIWEKEYHAADEEYMKNYIARKQAHLHKLAMVLAAAEHDDLILSKENLQLANAMLLTTEGELEKVFAKVGMTEAGLHSARFAGFVQRRGEVPYAEAVQFIQAYFSDFRELEGMLNTWVRSGQIELFPKGPVWWLRWKGNERVL